MHSDKEHGARSLLGSIFILILVVFFVFFGRSVWNWLQESFNKVNNLHRAGDSSSMEEIEENEAQLKNREK